VTVLQGDGNLWWSGSTNKCVEYVLQKANDDDCIFTLNNDTELATDTLSNLMNFYAQNPNSIIACGNYFWDDKSRLEATAFVKRKKYPFPLYHEPLFPYGTKRSELSQSSYEVSSVSGKGVLIPVTVFKQIGLYNAEKLPQYHGDTEFTRRASEAGYKVFINLNAIIYTDQNATGIGQVNSPTISMKEFIQSFSALRSENHLTTLYYRSKLIYGNKWLFYLVFNILSISYRFMIRYFQHTNPLKKLSRTQF
jgi:GT2 family glycosyltransferase